MSISPKKSSTEQLYELALEREVEDVSGEAEPSYHKNYAVPPALAILQKIISDNGHITIEDIDYQITKLELKPLRSPGHHDHGHHHHDHGDDEYQKQMEIVHERRSRRNFASSEFHTQVAAKQYHDAFHTYVAETTENHYQPVTLTPKKSSDGGTAVVLEIDGVDYFLKDQYTAADAKSIQSRLNVPAKASVDQWPEEVVIYEPSDKSDKKDRYVPRTYIRGDVLPVDGGKGFDHRLLPREENIDASVQGATSAGARKKKGKKAAKKKVKKAANKKATKGTTKKSKKKKA